MNDVVKVHSDNRLFDIDHFKARLEHEPTLDVFKSQINHLNETQFEIFKENYTDDDVVRHLVYGRAWVIDQLLSVAWNLQPWKTDQCSLIAVGGYGRGELLPCSDIDLLLLFKSEKQIEANKDAIQSFITFLWDINLNVGHSVRSIPQCVKQAKLDLTVITTLMEHRLISGDSLLLNAMSEKIQPSKIWSSRDFFLGKRQEQEDRHNKFNETEYNLEPNLKSSPGGLRDIQTIGWVAKRHYGDSRNRDLVTRGFLTNIEYQALRSGLAFLWRFRFALHMVTGREEDRILFDLQSQLAVLFNYKDRDGKMAVECMMQDYYRKVIRLRSLNEMLLQHFDEVIIQKDKEDQVIDVNERFQIRSGSIEAKHHLIFKQYPSALMEVFVLMAKIPEIKGIRASTIRLIRQHRYLVDEQFRQDKTNQNLFIELLRSGKGVSTNLLRMNRFGILGLYLPEFGRIVGQMQHDLFHIYTVDAHTLLVIRNLRKFRHRGNTEKYPLATEIIRALPKIEIAYIAALYHDIAKGRGGDHSKLGAPDAVAFCERHGLTQSESTQIAWLVENHLLMSMTAQKKDISDPQVVQEFAAKVKKQSNLNYLMVLTIADINATNPTIWNGWKASLLKQLYIETRRYLSAGELATEDRESRIANRKQDAMTLLLKQGFTEQQVLEIWDNPGDEYFLRESAENIAWHCSEISKSGTGKPVILIREINEKDYEGASQIFVYAPDRPHLFADIAKAIESLHLNIHDARIMTADSSDFSLDTFIVLDDEGHSLGSDPKTIKRIQKKLLQAIKHPDKIRSSNRRIPRRLKHFHIPAQAKFSKDALNDRTQVDVLTTDRPGLLAQIGDFFRQHHIRIQNARIATFGERVEDVFFVVDENDRALNEALIPELSKELEQHLDKFHED